VTITLSNIPDLTASVSVPRLAGIEHPFSRILGNPGDLSGQMAVLRATLQALQAIDIPGGVEHLPFEWSQTPEEAKSSLPEPPPIGPYLSKHPWHLGNLLSRQIPEKYAVE
jgi:hypothetical protein